MGSQLDLGFPAVSSSSDGSSTSITSALVARSGARSGVDAAVSQWRRVLPVVAAEAAWADTHLASLVVAREASPVDLQVALVVEKPAEGALVEVEFINKINHAPGPNLWASPGILYANGAEVGPSTLISPQVLTHEPVDPLVLHPVDFKGRRLDRWCSPTRGVMVRAAGVVVDEAFESVLLGDPGADSWVWTQPGSGLAAEVNSDLHLGTVDSRARSVDLGNLGLPIIDLVDLENAWTVEEVWNVIKSMPADKAPGPDGFSLNFYHKCWDIIRKDVVDALNCLFFCRDRGFNSLNQALVFLLSKKDVSVEMRDFRPISLVHSFGKIFSKLLASRLGHRMPDLVAINQSAFIRGRSILDNFMLVQNVIRALHRKKSASIFLKMDFVRAFDSVSWPFILEVLRAHGFGEKWCAWIIAILSTSSSKILLNGHATERIWHHRGLRQGDPLFPLLFVIVMDVLAALFKVADARGLFESLSTFGVKHRLSLFADDVALVVRPSGREIRVALEILNLFGDGSGLRVNYSKSAATMIRCGGLDVDSICSMLPCATVDFPCTYLGLPLSTSRLPKAQLQPYIDKLANRLTMWKGSLLDLAGRAVLVKAVLTSMTIYCMMALDLPVWMVNALEGLLSWILVVWQTFG
ncbi:hypothetical protein ACQ4PT_070893 [Festuca glaucescens]